MRRNRKHVTLGRQSFHSVWVWWLRCGYSVSHNWLDVKWMHFAPRPRITLHQKRNKRYSIVCWCISISQSHSETWNHYYYYGEILNGNYNHILVMHILQIWNGNRRQFSIQLSAMSGTSGFRKSIDFRILKRKEWLNVQDIWYAVSDRHRRNCDKVHTVAKVMTRNGRKIKVKGFKSFRRKTNSIPTDS